MSEGGYRGRYTQHFQEQLFELPSEVLGNVLDGIETIKAMPRLGRPYEPEFESDAPPTPCQHYYVPGTTKRLFFIVDDAKREVRYFHIADTRQDPHSVFVGVHGA